MGTHRSKSSSRSHETAVIFDVDGVLVDSYQAHFQSWSELAAENGITFTQKQFSESFGRTSRDIIRTYWKQALNDEQIRTLDERKEMLYRQIIAADFPAMPGAVALIDSLLHQGFRLGVGSSGPPQNIELTLDRLQRRHAFAAVVTGADVQRGKPDPQVYIVAAQRLGIAAKSCVVIEDAPAGVQAACAAQMKCIALLNHGRNESMFAQHPPSLFVRSLSEITSQTITRILT